MADEKKNLTWLWIVIALIVGFLICFALFPRTIEKQVTVTKEVPVEKIVYVNNTQTETIEVPLNLEETYLDPAVDELFVYLEDEDMLKCGWHQYDIDQVKIGRIYDDWGINFEEDGYTVVYQVKLKYLDTDTEEKCYLTFNPSVYYEEGEDPEVTLL